MYAGTDDRWIKVHEERPRAALRLFCFPYAGSGASAYRLWPVELPDSVEVCAVQLPGRESRFREEPHRRMEPLADATAEALRGHLDRPFAFFGHSMGGALAFEVTRRLAAGNGGGRVPEHLFVSGRPAPRAPGKEEPIHDLPREQFIQELRSYRGTPEEVLQNPELMELLEPLLRADFSVAETYEYDRPQDAPPPLDIPLTALGGVEDEDVSEEDLEAWSRETSGPFRKHLFRGDHFFLVARRSEVLGVVRRQLEQHLATSG